MYVQMLVMRGLLLVGCLALRAGADEAPAAANAGVVNDALRAESSAWQKLDLGGQLRLRYEDHDKAGAFPNDDFVGNAATNSNAELLTRITGHVVIHRSIG